MGQKVNPHGFRLGVNKGWNSVWYVPANQYADTLHQDLKVRKFVTEKLSNAGVEHVKIKRAMSKTLVEVKVARPGVVIGKAGAGIEALKVELTKMIGAGVELKIFEVKRPEARATIIAENIKNQLLRRIAPKFAAQRDIEAARQTGLIKGIKIWISGRIRGAEIARTEKFQWGSVPLQTLRADIDYSFVEAIVPSAGKHGIKVWVNLGEKSGVSQD